jgi:hypothetical protein
MTGPPKLLVGEASATSGLSHRHGNYNIHSLAKDHSGLVKFGRSDPEYSNKVLLVLEPMIRNAWGIKVDKVQTKQKVQYRY